MNRLVALAPLFLAIVGCNVHDRSESRWIGPLTAKQPSQNCPPTKGVLIVRDGNITFAPDEGTWVLSGTAGPKILTATRSRPTSDHKTYKTDLRAVWTDQTVQGDYTTPDCAYRVDLHQY